MLPFLWNVFVSLRSGKVAGDDPWEGNTLEWATTLAAAAVQLRPPARDPLRAAALRPPARPDGRALSDDDDDRRQPRPGPAPSTRPIAGLAHDRRGGISNPVLGMLLFITSEVMFFAGLFAAYFSVRAHAAAVAARGVPRNAPDPAARRARPTILLILSSFTCQIARLGDPPRRPDARSCGTWP